MSYYQPNQSSRSDQNSVYANPHLPQQQGPQPRSRPQSTIHHYQSQISHQAPLPPPRPASAYMAPFPRQRQVSDEPTYRPPYPSIVPQRSSQLIPPFQQQTRHTLPLSNALPPRSTSLSGPILESAGYHHENNMTYASTVTDTHTFYQSPTPVNSLPNYEERVDVDDNRVSLPSIHDPSSIAAPFSSLSMGTGTLTDTPFTTHSQEMQHQSYPSSSSSSLSSASTATEPPRTILLPTIESIQDRVLTLDTAEDIDQITWAQDVLRLVDRHLTPSGGGGPTDFTHPDAPPPNTSKLPPALKDLLENAVPMIIVISTSTNTKASALACYLKAKMLSSGLCNDILPKNPRQAFKDFENAARNGEIRGWFRLGRDYEGVNDLSRAKDCYERGVKRGDCECTYRMGMAHLLGQLKLPINPSMALSLLQQASEISTIDFPQPSYVYGMLLAGELQVPTEIPSSLVLPPTSIPSDLLYTQWSTARDAIERAAYLSYPPAQYKAGHLYEHASLGTSYDPLVSVNWYTYASKNGETEADMALSKWFLCGAEGHFPKNENLAKTFAEKAARKNHPNGCFALGYYYELGVGGRQDLDQARKWYHKAASLGNADAPLRLSALSAPIPTSISMAEHETRLNDTLVRKRTQAKIRSDRQSTSRPTRRIVPPQPLPTQAFPHPQGYSSPRPQEWDKAHPQITMHMPMPITMPMPMSPTPMSPAPKVGELMSPNPNSAYGISTSTSNTFPRPPIPHQSFNRPTATQENQTFPRRQQGQSIGRIDENGRRPSAVSSSTSLSDLPIPEERRNSAPAPPPVQGSKKEAKTFAEMGFQSKPVEEDGCSIM
ncbi:uncharacterized protein IL334_003878 [Kwoniella shivajii]|uniref:HCP-like protein n=1 Tax=Kwoniella shivajii TaxID=564305 RepID=A0ABZ1CZD9_9TREE|nr:hypothetical protein IL334_003878 [Kwoniella shivajii]